MCVQVQVQTEVGPPEELQRSSVLIGCSFGFNGWFNSQGRLFGLWFWTGFILKKMATLLYFINPFLDHLLWNVFISFFVCNNRFFFLLLTFFFNHFEAAPEFMDWDATTFDLACRSRTILMAYI